MEGRPRWRVVQDAQEGFGGGVANAFQPPLESDEQNKVDALVAARAELEMIEDLEHRRGPRERNNQLEKGCRNRGTTGGSKGIAILSNADRQEEPRRRNEPLRQEVQAESNHHRKQRLDRLFKIALVRTKRLTAYSFNDEKNCAACALKVASSSVPEDPASEVASAAMSAVALCTSPSA